MKRSKYRAVPTVVDNIRFASKLEARRYGELKILERAGKISGLRRQPVVVLNALGGEIVGKYVPDFCYLDEDSKQWIYEDCKGFSTPLYKFKKKCVEAQYGIKITEIRAK